MYPVEACPLDLEQRLSRVSIILGQSSHKPQQAEKQFVPLLDFLSKWDTLHVQKEA